MSNYKSKEDIYTSRTGVDAIIFAAKAREGDEVRQMMRAYELPEVVVMLDGSLGENDSDIDYIIQNTDDVVKLKMLNKINSADDIERLNKETARKLIRQCSDIFIIRPYLRVDFKRDDVLDNVLTAFGPLDHYNSAIKFLDLCERVFDNDEEFSYIFNKIASSTDNGEYSKFHSYDYLIQNIITSTARKDMSLIDKGWIRKERALSRNGINMFIDSKYDERAFIHMFKGFIQIQQKLSSYEDGTQEISQIVRTRIKAYAKVLLSQLDKGVNDSLVFFGNRNSTQAINPIGSAMMDFAESVVGHTFSDDFKAQVIGKLLISMCNGNTKNIRNSAYMGIIEFAEPLVDWKLIVESLNKKGKEFLAEKSRNPDLFEPYLDKKSRAILLRSDLSL